MSDQNTPPPITLELGGIEDFETAAAMLRATGARRPRTGRSQRRAAGRTFVIDHDLTAHQTAALVEFIAYGTAEGFLTVTTHTPHPDTAGAEEWWSTA